MSHSCKDPGVPTYNKVRQSVPRTQYIRRGRAKIWPVSMVLSAHGNLDRAQAGDRDITLQYNTTQYQRIHYMHAYMNLFVHSFVHSFMHSFIHSLHLQTHKADRRTDRRAIIVYIMGCADIWHVRVRAL